MPPTRDFVTIVGKLRVIFDDAGKTILKQKNQLSNVLFKLIYSLPPSTDSLENNPQKLYNSMNFIMNDIRKLDEHFNNIEQHTEYSEAAGILTHYLHLIKLLDNLKTARDENQTLARYDPFISGFSIMAEKLSALEKQIEKVKETNKYLNFQNGGKSQKKDLKCTWTRTTRKVQVKSGRGKDATTTIKTVYKNSKTGEHRVRKMVTRDGKKNAIYVKF